MNRLPVLLAAAFLAAVPAFAAAGELANITVVTDANPDYSDMESMVHSITSNWKTDQEKMYALFYWDHIARRQTQPMYLHGYPLTDPIRQYNDYGYTMCSTISGIKCSTWNYMGYPCRYFDINNHTVPDVWYNGRFHLYDNSLSMIYSLPDGKTIASVEDIGKMGAGPETGGKQVPGYIALYHAITGTGPNGYCQGADVARPLSQIVEDFAPSGLKYRFYYYDQDRSHRYILNLRDSEVYTRYYSRQDAHSPNAVPQFDKNYTADPAYYVPNGGKDPEAYNPRYHLRGNGDRTWTPLLDAGHFASEVYSSTNIKATAAGLEAADPSKPAEAVFKVEGANVITSLKIHAVAPGASIAISTTNGVHWKDLWKSGKPGDDTADLKLIDEVNGSYAVLVKVTLHNAPLKAISFDTITEINAYTQPTLHLGKNTVYVGNGDQSESIVLWPNLEDGNYKPYLYEQSNIAVGKYNGYQGVMHYDQGNKEGYLIFKVDAPTDVTSITYGGRLYNRDANNHIDFLHSFDGGKTWKKDYSLTDTKTPWDVIHYETVNNIPGGTRSVLFKYSLNGPGTWDKHKGDMGICSLYNIHMEVDHKLVTPSSGPLDVTFNWSERQKDHSLIQRSHTEVVGKLPATYTIDVGGDDQPVVDSLAVSLHGARPDLKAGYSDGKDVGGVKWVGNWATYGKNLALNKPYTVSVPPADPKNVWGANDASHKRLTDGQVGSSYTGGGSYEEGAGWTRGSNPEITVDLGDVQKVAAFRIHFLGYPYDDAMLGEVKDKVEVLTSTDGEAFTSAGFFDFNLHQKDLPVNYVSNDEDTFYAFNYTLPAAKRIDARFIKFKVTPARVLIITQVEALDSYELKPFDLRIALPNPADNGKAPPKPDLSPNARKWGPNEPLPKTIGKDWAPGVGSGE